MAHSIVQFINGLLVHLFDILFWPFRHTEPIWSLIIISGLSGVLMLWIFGRVSQQHAIRNIRERIRGNILGVRLYQHDVRVVLKLQGTIMRDIFTYLTYAFLPTLVLMIPVIFILAQLNLRFALSPLSPGSSAVVKVTLQDRANIATPIHLEVPDGLVVETPGVHIRSQGEVAWRIRAVKPGQHVLNVNVDGHVTAKKVWVGEGWGAVTALRTRSLITALLYPGEPLLSPTDGVASIEVQYPALTLTCFGWPMHWLVMFLVLSLLTGFACKRLLGVEV
ncbi:MAG: hypothetical protein ETSY1_10460 [Candidatus Entotheonella factor]|uniref:Uncharacterized protein n=1 Tax=Entotheonella factor TaxID=1429438 RepID=W4LRL8_ENTF1|nr:MAG: hypothetical protein ETSY1_10460 [Candidatus Entotheonella factor]